MEMEQFHNLWPVRNRTNHFATIAVGCGIIGPLCLVVPYGVVFTPFITIAGCLAGIIALLLIYRPKSRYEGLTAAIIGIALCAAEFILLGFFIAALANYARIPLYGSNARKIVLSLNSYAHDHQGRYPSSLDALALPPTMRFYEHFSFYHFRSRSPILLNGHLAGKSPDQIAHPASTILLAVGKDTERRVFYSLDEIKFSGKYKNSPVIFLDGSCRYLYHRDIPRHFPGAGTATEDTWYIQPVFRQVIK